MFITWDVQTKYYIFPREVMQQNCRLPKNLWKFCSWRFLRFSEINPWLTSSGDHSTLSNRWDEAWAVWTLMKKVPIFSMSPVTAILLRQPCVCPGTTPVLTLVQTREQDRISGEVVATNTYLVLHTEMLFSQATMPLVIFSAYQIAYQKMIIKSFRWRVQNSGLTIMNFE